METPSPSLFRIKYNPDRDWNPNINVEEGNKRLIFSTGKLVDFVTKNTVDITDGRSAITIFISAKYSTS